MGVRAFALGLRDAGCWPEPRLRDVGCWPGPGSHVVFQAIFADLTNSSRDFSRSRCGLDEPKPTRGPVVGGRVLAGDLARFDPGRRAAGLLERALGRLRGWLRGRFSTRLRLLERELERDDGRYARSRAASLSVPGPKFRSARAQPPEFGEAARRLAATKSTAA